MNPENLAAFNGGVFFASSSSNMVVKIDYAWLSASWTSFASHWRWHSCVTFTGAAGLARKSVRSSAPTPPATGSQQAPSATTSAPNLPDLMFRDLECVAEINSASPSTTTRRPAGDPDSDPYSSDDEEDSGDDGGDGG